MAPALPAFKATQRNFIPEAQGQASQQPPMTSLRASRDDLPKMAAERGRAPWSYPRGDWARPRRRRALIGPRRVVPGRAGGLAGVGRGPPGNVAASRRHVCGAGLGGRAAGGERARAAGGGAAAAGETGRGCRGHLLPGLVLSLGAERVVRELPGTVTCVVVAPGADVQQMCAPPTRGAKGAQAGLWGTPGEDCTFWTGES